MMMCPSCSSPLVSGEARCTSCRALVNPPTQGAGALAPRMVTPESIEGLADASIESQALGWENPPSPSRFAEARPSSESKNPEDEAWRREVLERVRKRRQVKTHALPLFVEGPPAPAEPEASVEPMVTASEPGPRSLPAYISSDSILDDVDSLESVDPRVATPTPPDLLASLDVPLNGSSDDSPFDLPLRPAESGGVSSTARSSSSELPMQNLVERARPTLVTGPITRSLVADLPLVTPSRVDPLPAELPSRMAASAVSSRAASINDRLQAAFIDVGVWSAMTATAFYFASRIARTSIMGLGPAWQGLALFGVVLAAAYMLFFGGLSGATPGKIACGIHVKRYDGSSLGPLASLTRGFLGVLGVVALGIGVWPAFWDKDRRTLYDRATDSRVTTV